MVIIDMDMVFGITRFLKTGFSEIGVIWSINVAFGRIDDRVDMVDLLFGFGEGRLMRTEMGGGFGIHNKIYY